MPHFNITLRTIFLLFATFCGFSLGDIASACYISATAICNGGDYPWEIRWKILDPSGNVLVSGKGGESKPFCLSKGGVYTAVGRDTYGDGWNNGFLKVDDAANRRIYFGPWSGPQVSDQSEVRKRFNVPCRAGTYEYNSICINCPTGRYGIRTGQNSVNASCAYKNSTCPAGYFCPGKGGTAATPCPSGKYGSTTGQTTQAGACPYTCASGTYGDLPGKTNFSTACVVCPAGAYCNGNGTLIPCPLGRYGRANTTKQANLSFACPYFCLQGKYGLVKGKISSKHACTDCVKGKYGNTVGAAATCAYKCPLGKRGILSGGLNETAACRNCDNGKYQDIPGETTCKACVRGTYTSMNSTKNNCTVCSSNTYQDETGQGACKECPAGTFTLSSKIPSSTHHDTILKCTTEPKCPFEPLRKFYALNASCYIHKTFVVHGSVTIVGHGNNITITSPGSGRIFDVSIGASLVIENVALVAKRENTCTDSSLGHYCNSGGLVVRRNGRFIVKNASFAYNWQQNGGVVYGEENVTVFLESSIFHDNYAREKGGVLNLESGSRLTITNCEFYNNQLANTYKSKGTVIYGGDNVSIKVHNSHFENHGYQTPDGFEAGLSEVATGYAGGILFCGQYCDASFERCNFHRNRAFIAGVAYLNKMSAVRLNLCVFSQNYAGLNGGVIFMEANGHITFQNCNASNNTAGADNPAYNLIDGNGGALHLEDPGSVVISRSSFRHNTAQTFGGAIYIGFAQNSLNTDAKLILIEESNFMFNKVWTGSLEFINNGDNNGGAICIDGAYVPVQVTNCQFEKNFARDNGGALWFGKPHNLSITQSIFSGNSALKGGALHLALDRDSIVAVINSSFYSNVALKLDGDGGGSIFISPDNSLFSLTRKVDLLVSVTNTLFNDNSAKQNGGAICIIGSYGSLHSPIITTVFRNTSFTNNSAGLRGGGVYMSYGTVDGMSLAFSANYAAIEGGGMYITNGLDNPSYLRKCKFIRNHAPEGGYALTVDSLKLRLERSVVAANYGAPTNVFSKVGGAITARNLKNVVANDNKIFAQSLDVVDTIFTKNIGHYGSCFNLVGPHSVHIKNCSFIGNEATKSGGAIYVTNSVALYVSSSNFLKNKAGLDGGAICISTSSKLIGHGGSSNNHICNILYSSCKHSQIFIIN